jgi:hypothetical protein
MRHGIVRRLQCAAVAMLLLGTGCASTFKKDEKAVEHQAVNCATADGDIRVLKGEKAHVAEQIALGDAIYPAGLVIGLLTEPKAPSSGWRLVSTTRRSTRRSRRSRRPVVSVDEEGDKNRFVLGLRRAVAPRR